MSFVQPADAEETRVATVTLKRNALTVVCAFGPGGRLLKKSERRAGLCRDFAYDFDAAGRLVRVIQGNEVTEQYRYNKGGQRSEQRRAPGGLRGLTDGLLHYDQKGRLARAGDTSFDYDAGSALRERRDRRGAFGFRYGKGGLLEAVTLPSGEELRYEYDKSNPIGPARRYRCDNLTAEYVWLDPLRLAAFLDHDHQLEYTFTFSQEGLPDRVRITPMSIAWSAAHKPGRGAPLTMEQTMDWLSGMAAANRRARLQPLFGNADKPLELLCGCDQAGTLKTLTDACGRAIKEIEYDSFGNVLHDTNPDLRLPLGFAGGLVDHATGLVRFGFRDYDPSVGRFSRFH